MTPRASARSLHAALSRLHRSYHARLVARASVRAAGWAAAIIVAAVLAGLVASGGVTWAGARLAVTLAAIAVAIGWAVRGYLGRALRLDTYLETIEHRFPEVRSWLRNALDFERRETPHASAELQRAVVTEMTARLDGVPVASTHPRLSPLRPLLAMAAGVVVLAAAGALAPESTARSWRTLWQPALAAPPVRLVVEPGAVKITPGASLAVRARVWGAAAVPTLHRRGESAPAAIAEGRDQDGSRVWRFDLAQLTREQDYFVKVAHVKSPTYTIALAGEPLPVSFEIEYRAPAYARLPAQRGTATRGDLSALRGTLARVEATFDRDLAGLVAHLPGRGPVEWKPVTARRWRGEVVLDREGEYALDARAASGEASYRYRIQPLADAPPVLVVRTPSRDVDLPAGQQIPVEVLAQDDLGLSELKLQHRKDAAAPWTDVPLARFAQRPREAAVEARWDASSLALLPGESATFRFELYDDNAVSGRGRTVSPTFELRFPSMADLYEDIDRRQHGVQETLEKVSEQTRELQKSLDKLAREPARTQAQRATPSFERSEEMQRALERQQEMAQRLDEAARQLRESVEQAAERQAFDERLMRKLDEMNQLMQQVQSPEFRDAMKKMQEALQRLDRQQLEQQLPDWRAANQEMLQNLERTIELLKQLRQEEQIASLAKRAEELKERQDALNREQDGKPKGESQPERDAAARAQSERQQRESEQSKALGQEAQKLAREMENQPQSENLEEAAQELEREAAEEQREAAEAMAQGEPQRAKQSGQKASQSLERAAQRLSQMADAMAQERESVDLAALRRAAQDLLSLQRETERNLSSEAPTEHKADRQTDLSDGVARVADSLAILSQRTPFITPKLSQSLGRAMGELSESGKAMGAGNRTRGEASGKSGGSALNEAVLELRKTEGAMCQMPGSNPNKPGNSTQQISRMGEQQSQINRQTQGLAKRLSEQMRLSTGDREQLERLAEQQQRLREQLEQVQRDEDLRRELLGRLDGAKRDMEEVEEALRAGATGGDLEEKQQRILSRLLDAQRSVNRRDFDPQRESRPGEEPVARSAPALPDELLRESDRLRLDLLKTEADRYPAQYRGFIEAYLRALNGGRP